MTAWNKGKPHTAEHIKNSSEAHMKINFNDVLAQREFKLLSPYVNTHTKVKLQCKLGHDFENTPAHIKSGQRCGICSPGVSERICRAFFEAIFRENDTTYKKDVGRKFTRSIDKLFERLHRITDSFQIIRVSQFQNNLRGTLRNN